MTKKRLIALLSVIVVVVAIVAFAAGDWAGHAQTAARSTPTTTVGEGPVYPLTNPSPRPNGTPIK
ncbi:MAG TPA: hypothetical protein VFQ25_07390 [Ktedonobacterales bacterium]|nr:hypothetical protein [Ktedonobacterales bacterium]